MNITAGTARSDFEQLPEEAYNLINDIPEPAFLVAKAGAFAVCTRRFKLAAAAEYIALAVAVFINVTGSCCFYYFNVSTAESTVYYIEAALVAGGLNLCNTDD